MLAAYRVTTARTTEDFDDQGFAEQMAAAIRQQPGTLSCTVSAVVAT